MRHQRFGQKLSRDTNARKALQNNLASSLMIYGQVKTTIAKAKFVKGHVEKLITLAKKNKLSGNRDLASKINHSAFLKLVNEIGPGFEGRKGGYTRILKLQSRRGDSAEMARLELLEWDKTKVKLLKQKSPKKIEGKKSAVKKSKTQTKPEKKKSLTPKEVKK